MKLLFEITPDYLKGYEGDEVFRAKVTYSIYSNTGITDLRVEFPFNCLHYINNNLRLAEDIWATVLRHAEAVLIEDKEFQSITSS